MRFHFHIRLNNWEEISFVSHWINITTAYLTVFFMYFIEVNNKINFSCVSFDNLHSCFVFSTVHLRASIRLVSFSEPFSQHRYIRFIFSDVTFTLRVCHLTLFFLFITHIHNGWFPFTRSWRHWLKFLELPLSDTRLSYLNLFFFSNNSFRKIE